MVAGRATYEVRSRRDVSRGVLRKIEAASLESLRAVGRKLADNTVETAIGLAEDVLVTDRPPSRRRTDYHGEHAHYIDSFKVRAPDVSGGRLRIEIRNDHPFAQGIENGVPPHEIPGPGWFPVESSTWGGGNYAAEGPPWWAYGTPYPSVNWVPGNSAGGYKIVKRALDEEVRSATVAVIVDIAGRV